MYLLSNAEAGSYQATHTVTMKRTEDTPAYTQMSGISPEASSSASRTMQSSHQDDGASQTFPVQEFPIEDEEDIEAMLQCLRIQCGNKLRKGKYKVEVKFC